MTADDIRLCAFNLNILRCDGHAAFNPFERLGRRHIQIGFEKDFLLFLGYALGTQKARDLSPPGFH